MSENFQQPRHWIGTEELSADYWSNPAAVEKRAQEFHDKPLETLELIERLDTKGIKRRDFLTLMGASMAMASFACARRPVHKIIPYVVKPEEITGGIANYYATVCPETGYGLLAKVREGRPIKLEGNPDHPMNRGKLSARDQAQILDLYDMDRAKEPKKISRGKGSSAVKWEEVDAEIAFKLKQIAAGSGRVRVLSGRMLSESTKRLTGEFLSGFAAGSHLEYDPISLEDMVDGQNEAYGTAVVPTYHFDQADVVLSLGADFLGTWVSPVEFAQDWSKSRKLNSKSAKSTSMSKLFVAESMMSVTGANADVRFPVRPGDELKIGAAIANEVAKKKGSAVPAALASYSVEAVASDVGIDVKLLKDAADALVAAAGKSIVVAGGLSSKTADAPALQAVANFLNSTLGNDGKTVDGTAQPFTKTGGRFSEVAKLISEMNSGAVDALIVYRSNPVYSLPAVTGFTQALGKVPLVISITDREDETALLSDFLLPDNHFLESWGDAMPKKGVVSVQQPTLAPIHSTRSYQDSLISLAKGASLKSKGLLASTATVTSWYDYLRANWKENVFKGASFDSDWENVLRDGVVDKSFSKAGSSSSRAFRVGALAAVPTFSKKTDGLVLATYEKVGMGDGLRANNPWLQELPDAITTATWDNYAAISPALAKKYSLSSDDVIDISSPSGKIALPVYVQPGLHPSVVAIAVGYGRTAAGKVGNEVGRDVKGFVTIAGNRLVFSGASVEIAKTGRRYQVATTQWHNATEDRPIVNDLTLAEFKANPKEANHTDPHLRMGEVPSLWPKHEYKGNRWGMAIDLTACTGCSACVIACQSENNIPVVGRDNVRKSREMHWIRIDRYYSGSPENPDVVFQPMLCQHCENAPCETVCPVVATIHDDEGLNSQIYNRCVGTRYCQNNCPYKVRRFNFFDHWKAYEGSMNLAWNPDVTVRTRGIMEKCTFCIQRIRDVKDKAKDEGRKVLDGELKTACQQTCPTDAITFGNINDPDAKVSQLQRDDRSFRVLEILNTVPSIAYLTKVRNKESAGEHHG